MKPQVNLYNLEVKGIRSGLHAKRVYQIVFAFLIALLAWSLIEAIVYVNLETKLNEDKAELSKSKLELAIYAEENPDAAKSIDLSAALESKQELRGEKESLLSSLQQNSNVSFDGFQKYFQALSENNVKGLWLEKFSLSEAGQNVAIQGATRDSSLLPKYIKGLENSAFSGTAFDGMSITNKTRYFSFELTTHPDSEQKMANETGLPKGINSAIQNIGSEAINEIINDAISTGAGGL